jgi:hypothetical protein
MGVIKCGILAARIQGKVGNQVFYMHGASQCVRAMPTTNADPNSMKQQVIRNLVSTLTTEWADGTISNAKKTMWDAYAKRARQVAGMRGGVLDPPKSPDNILAGINSFVWVNVMLLKTNQALVTDPPNLSTPRPGLLMQDDPDWTDPNFTLSWLTPAAYTAMKVIGHMTFSKGVYHPQNTVAVQGNVGAIVVTMPTGLGGAEITLTSQTPLTIHSGLRYVGADGFVSKVSNTQTHLLN